MYATVNQYLAGMASDRDKAALRPIFVAGSNLDSSQQITSAAMVIFGAGSPVVKTGVSGSSYSIANGIIQIVLPGTNLPALVGSVLHATFNVFCFYINSAGVITSAMGVSGTTLSGAKFPILPLGQALIGFVIINPTGTGTFIGGTTALDDATTLPNTAYVNLTGSFDTSIITG